MGLRAAEVTKIRGQISLNLPSNITLFRLVAYNLLPIISLASLSYFWRNKSIKTFCIFALISLNSLFLNTLNLNKSAVIFWFIGCIFTLVFLNYKFNLKKIIIALGTSFILLILSFTFILPNQTLPSTIKSITNRTIISQSVGNNATMYVYPKKEEHIGLRSISKRLEILGIEPKERSSRVIMRYAQPEAVKKKIAGYMVSTFIGEAYANFGYIGLILSPFIISFILCLFVGILINLPKSDITI